MTLEYQNETTIIKYLGDKIKLYEKWRGITYQSIDTTHFSPNNKHIFNTLVEIQIRLDELFQLKTELSRRIDEE